MIPLGNDWKTSPRNVSLSILEEVFDKGAYSNIALNSFLSASPLSHKDKSLTTEIVYGVISRKITLEWYLSHYIEDREKLDSWVYYLLMLSLYQLLYLDKIPNHAVVNEAVLIAKKRERHGASDKLINAVLRRISREELPDTSIIKRKNKRLSITYSIPVWLVKKLTEQYGEERAIALMASLLERNKASVRVSSLDKYETIMQETQAQPSKISSVGLVKASGHFAGTSYFENGDITIQDESSQLVAPIMNIKGEEKVLDACSAPGGKSVHMASYLTSGHLTSLDLYNHKLDLVNNNAQRLHVADKISTQQLDASKVHEYFDADSFDKILVDAPCSGFGLMRRKPDIKYQKSLQDIQQLQSTQLAILDSVCQTLRKGGIMTYSTCTIFEEENSQIVMKFLASHPHFEQVQLSHRQADIVQDGCITITPEQYGTDGFFIAQFRRIL